MSLDLPDLLADYFVAENRGDTDGLGACFADHAIVRDEGQTIEGVAAVDERRQEEVSAQGRADRGRETGWKDCRYRKGFWEFSQQPVNLDHIFGIESDRIASLEIR